MTSVRNWPVWVLISDCIIPKVSGGLGCDGEIISAGVCVLTSGLVNTYHRQYQTPARTNPGGQNALFFGG